jgi:hypothetical protein
VAPQAGWNHEGHATAVSSTGASKAWGFQTGKLYVPQNALLPHQGVQISAERTLLALVASGCTQTCILAYLVLDEAWC